MKKKLALIVTLSLFILLFFLRSESREESRWIETSHLSSVSRSEPLRVNVKVGHVPEGNLLKVDLHYKDYGDYGYLMSGKRVPVTAGDEVVYTFDLPSDYHGRAVFAVFYLSPTGGWNDRTYTSYGHGIIVGDLSVISRLKFFISGKLSPFSHLYYSPAFVEEGEGIKRPTNRGTTDEDRALLLFGCLLLAPFLVGEGKGERGYLLGAMALLVYGILAGFDLFNFSTDLVRRAIKELGFYSFRRPFQFLLSVILFYGAYRRSLRLNREKRLIFIVCISLLYLSSFFEMISFHYIDSVFYAGFYAFTYVGIARLLILGTLGASLITLKVQSVRSH